MKRKISLLIVLSLITMILFPWKNVSAEELKLSKAKATLEVDATLKLTLGSVKGNQITWKSSDKKIASISKWGTITAKDEGNASITATYNKKKYTCKVTVVDSNKELTTGLSAEELVKTLQKSIDTIDNLIVYTEKTDTNNLLGKPNQYTSKVNFADTRIEQYDKENPDGGTIEVFANADDATTRKEYIETVTKGISFAQQYIYQIDNVLLRLDYDLTSDQAEEYYNELIDILEK